LVSGFPPFGWYIICKSHEFLPVDMLLFIAEKRNSQVMKKMQGIFALLGSFTAFT